jgi:hypothetical protein
MTTTRLGSLYSPVMGVIPSGVLASDVIANSVLSLTSGVTYRWDDANFKFTAQGQKWEPDNRPALIGGAYGGGKNAGTPRTITVTSVGMKDWHFGHILEFEFIFTGTQFSVEFMNRGGDGTSGFFGGPKNYGGDLQVYIEWGGHMWKAAELPKTSLRNDGGKSYRNIVFEQPYHGRIRVVMGTCGLIGIRTDGSAIVAPSPPRYFGIADGDSYFESSQALTADSTTQWFTNGIIDFLFELTGFCWARRGQGATGFFCNGTGQVFDDTIGRDTGSIIGQSVVIKGPSRYLSASRREWMTNAAGKAEFGNSFINYPGEDFGQPVGRRPLVYLLNGTWNDASSGGVTEAQMYDRAKVCYQWVQSVDPNCTFVHVGPEPFNDTLFGSNIGPPTPGDKQDIHRQGQMRAAAEVPNTHYINPFGPANPWWTGPGPDPKNGSFGVPTNSPQAQLVSKTDGIHTRREGSRYYANKIADAMAEIPIPTVRAHGLA